jgi:ATPase family associated with various cellular activities (AAA)
MNLQLANPVTQSSSSWLFESAQHLRVLYASLRGKLDELGAAEEAEAEFETIEATCEHQSALGVLCSKFGLSRFERDVVVTLAMMNLDTGLPSIFLDRFSDGLPSATFLKLLDTFSGEATQHDQVSLAPESPLRRWGLVRVSDSQNSSDFALNARTLVLDDWVYLYLCGVQTLDGVLQGAIQSPDLERHLTLTQVQRGISEHASKQFGHSLVQIWGIETDIKSSLAREVARLCQTHLFSLNANNIPTQAETLERFTVSWNRLARVTANAALWINADDLSALDPTHTELRATAVSQFMLHCECPIVLTTRNPRSWGVPSVSFEVNKPSTSEQRELWKAYIFEHQNMQHQDSSQLEDRIANLASQFHFSGTMIERAVSEAFGQLEPETPAEQTLERLHHHLWQASLTLTRPALEGLTQRITPAGSASWERLVLPNAEAQVLKSMVEHINQRQKVFENWGWEADSSRGLGISALFSGSSGTGKTFSAEIIAKELGVDLQRIDLPSVVSKYIGESEKTLAKIFDAAEYGGSILLFDEADAVFGKRSEVKDANDRYANIEVSYLLQRMETFRGLVVLTTNQETSMDTAFLRRIRFIVRFPTPDKNARKLLWQTIFPSDTPTDNLDYEKLAQLEVSGGNIRNIALGAAFIAASSSDAASGVNMQHLLQSAQEEIRKLKRLPRSGELSAWV